MILMPGRSADQLSVSSRSETFTGTVWADPVLPKADGVGINNICFAPGARTFWHHHERGQILHVVAGAGLIRSAGGPVCPLRPGDIVWVPPGERHWHGAGPDSYLVHLAISLGDTVWHDEVADSCSSNSGHE